MAWGDGEREKQREFAWRSNPLEIVIGTSGGTSDRWKIQPPLSLAFNAKLSAIMARVCGLTNARIRGERVGKSWR